MSGEPARPVPLPSTPDPLRLRRLFEQHHAFLWRVVRRMGLNSEAADDVTQQVFVIAAERLSDIRHDKERSFLYGTALRLTRDVKRAQMRVVSDSGSDLVSQSPSVEDRIDDERAVRLLDTALSHMDSDLKEVFVLFELERMPTPQIAALIEIPVGTAASRLRRAREQFRNLVERLSQTSVGGQS